MLGMASGIAGAGRVGGGGNGTVMDCGIDETSGKVCRNSS